MTQPHDEPSAVSAEEGVVMMDGPGAIAASLTPDAAAETSDRLLDAACQAQGQQALKPGDGRLV